MSNTVKYARISTVEDGRFLDYEVGKDGVQSIERETGTLVYVVRRANGVTEHRSQEIISAELTEAEKDRLGTR